MENGTRQSHIAILPTPSMGHLIPISELTKLLPDRHHFTVTIITFSESHNRAQETFISSLPSSISSLSLPPIPLSDLPSDVGIETRMSVASARSIPSLHSLLQSLISSTRLVAFVGDLFSTPDAAKELAIPHYMPTKPLEWWGEGDQNILGGRDEIAGGTWLGCTKDGRVAFLTNFREPNFSSSAKSRGDLPLRFLQGNLSPFEYGDQIAKEAAEYNGFNLIIADLCSKVMVYVSNRPHDQHASVQVVSPGVHVLSNAKLDTPWPKVQRLHENFKNFLQRYGDEEILCKLFVEVMTDTAKAELNRLPITGCEPEWEFNLSSIFVDVETQMGRYGTRSMAALSVMSNGEVSFYERYLDVNAAVWKEHTVEYLIENFK